MSSLIVDVTKINKIEPHPNADRLRIASFNDMGWNCIIGLDDFQEGDLCVFFPPDVILPESLIDKYKLEYLKGNGRVKTVKLRGFISQGICLPIDCLPNSRGDWEGKNVAKILGITKYEAPSANYQNRPKETVKSVYLKYKAGDITFRRFIAKSIGLIKDSFKPKKNLNPLFNKYTDIENIKNFNTVFEDGEQIVITEKIHGTSFRAGNLKRPTKYFWQKWLLKLFGEYEFVYGSHNVQLSFGRKKTWYGDDVYGRIAKKYNLAEIIPEDYIIYGEIYGNKIQELNYGLEDSIDVVFFDVKYQGKYLDSNDFFLFCWDKGLPIVPISYRGEYSKEIVDQYTNAKNTILKAKNGHPAKQIREGVVVKPLKEEMNSRLGRKVLKSISAEYLLTKNRTEHH